ncbi:4-hydroxyproline epimerase [Robiginitalea sp. M366]|uniref:4-hydroxyproline epimerase n=1 Tax=Robiginitalea aestuariiviva TaxID=3036903 RepID=UPI00240E2D84|nr:4-hydroxyproline epimerase [Robiginitalea aestuariiviva]MDG1573378.1 4-hydroxyproline epimerase [Robiginitalea aestuariiviva]
MARHIFKCIDGHTAGNPVRVVAEGGPELQGRDMAERRQHFLREFDWIRKGLMFEPRGHDMMSGSIFYPPSDPANDLGILFIETSGCLPMCGHGTIGSITIGIEEGLIHPKTPGQVRLETPAGLVQIRYGQTGNKVDWVALTNVPSFLAARDLEIPDSPLGPIRLDVAYGGNFYAIVDPQPGFEGLQAYTASQLIGMSRELRRQVNAAYPEPFVHPLDPRIRSVSHILWAGTPLAEGATARNAVFYGDNAIDRSPCGTGTSARMAQWAARGRLQPGEVFVHESYIGSRFEGRIVGETQIGPFPAIIPEIRGSAWVHGYNTLIIDESHPFPEGFQVI